MTKPLENNITLMRELLDRESDDIKDLKVRADRLKSEQLKAESVFKVACENYAINCEHFTQCEKENEAIEMAVKVEIKAA